jgi:hypothetical protein
VGVRGDISRPGSLRDSLWCARPLLGSHSESCIACRPRGHGRRAWAGCAGAGECECKRIGGWGAGAHGSTPDDPAAPPHAGAGGTRLLWAAWPNAARAALHADRTRVRGLRAGPPGPCERVVWVRAPSLTGTLGRCRPARPALLPTSSPAPLRCRGGRWQQGRG